MPSIYDFPQYYDLVMNRPAEVVTTEVATLCTLFDRYGIQPQGGRVLELACGASAHGIPLAARGYAVTGVDASAAMLASAQEHATTANVAIHTAQADVIDFSLPEEPYDAALFMFETFPVITKDTDIRRHFAAVRRHLRPGGIYIVDIDAGLCVRTDAHGEWGRRVIPLPDGQLTLWHEDQPGDWIEGVIHLTLFCRIETDDLTVTTADPWTIRQYNPWILGLLAQTLDGWRLDGCYGWATGSPVQADDAHYFCVFVAT